MKSKPHKIILGSFAGLLMLINITAHASGPLATDAPTYRGKVILVVDKTMTADAQVVAKIDRLTHDLAGDGWRVLRHDVERAPDEIIDYVPNSGSYGDTSSENIAWAQLNAPRVREVRALIKADFDAAPDEIGNVVLIGHVPVPYSGTDKIIDGGHYYGAHPADLFYGEMYSQYGSAGWSDNITTMGINGVNASDNVPHDGKFDQDEMPTPVQFGVGRVDFSRMTCFPVNETTLLARYFDKDHDFRSGNFIVPRKAFIAQDPPSFPQFDLSSISQTFGSDNTHILTDGNMDWFPYVGGSDNVYLLGFGSGWGGPFGNGADHIGASGSVYGNGANHQNFYDTDSRAVFVNMFGSWFGHWDQPDNFLRAVIANPYDPANGRYGYGLTCAWADVSLDELALTKRVLGATIGEASFKNYSSLANFNLMGDPTLRIHTILPPTGITLSKTTSLVTLGWVASADAGTSGFIGYNVYYAPTSQGPFTLATTDGPVIATSCQITRPGGSVPDNFYMVRAVRTETVPVGSYVNMSEGVVAKLTGDLTPFLSIQNGPVTAYATVDTGDGIANSAAFTVDALGCDLAGNENIVYQWYKGSMALAVDDSHVKGVDTPSLLIKGLQTSDAGNYWVKVSNAKGFQNSAEAALILNSALPVANDDMVTAYRDTPVDIDVLANDTAGVVGASLSLLTVSAHLSNETGGQIIAGDAAGTITLSPDRKKVHFVPSQDWISGAAPGQLGNGVTSFKYKMTDGANVMQGWVEITTAPKPGNTPPSMVPSGIDDQQLMERTSIDIPLTVTDNDTSSEQVKVYVTSSSQNVYCSVSAGTGNSRTLHIFGNLPVNNAAVSVAFTDRDHISSYLNFQVTVTADSNLPELGSPAITGGSSENIFSFNVNGSASTPWTVYSSTDLKNWTAAGTVTLDGSGLGSYMDSGVSGLTCKFYKLSDGTHTTHAIGFERIAMEAAIDATHPSQKYVADQLLQAGGNGLDSAFAQTIALGGLPANAQLLKLNGNSFDTYTYTGSGWSGSTTLNPGEGAVLVNPTSSPFTVTFVGQVLEGQSAMPLLPNGNYLLSFMVPQAGRLRTDLGFELKDGDQVFLWRNGASVGYMYDSAVGVNPNNWYNGDESDVADEPILGVGEAAFIHPVGNGSWIQSYSPVVPALSSGQITASSYAFSVSGAANTAWAVYSSTDLKNWTVVGSVTLDNTGTGSYTDSGISGVGYKFYKLDNGTFTTRAIGFERATVAAGSTALIADQLENSSGNTFADVFTHISGSGGTSLPSGTVVELWNPTTTAWVDYTWSSGAWSPNGNALLTPGSGARIQNNSASAFTVTFVGLVPEGQLTTSLTQSVYNMVSSKVPQAGKIKTGLGFNPEDGDTVWFWRNGAWSTYAYDSTVGVNPDNWYNGDETEVADEPVVNVGEAMFIVTGAASASWTQNYSPAGGNVPLLTAGTVTASSFAFSANGTAGAAWTVYASTDLKNWTSAGSVTLNGSGTASYTDSGISGVGYKFYKLSNGTYTTRAIGFERATVDAGSTALIADQLENSSGNTFADVFTHISSSGGTSLPSGTVVELWNPTTTAWVDYTWSSGSWSPNGNALLTPGSGARIQNNSGSAFTVTFVGLVPEGQLTTSLTQSVNNLLSPVVPRTGKLKTDLGFSPGDGDQIIFWRNGASEAYMYDSTIGVNPDNWYNGDASDVATEPVVNVGEAMWIFASSDENWTQNYSPAP